VAISRLAALHGSPTTVVAAKRQQSLVGETTLEVKAVQDCNHEKASFDSSPIGDLEEAGVTEPFHFSSKTAGAMRPLSVPNDGKGYVAINIEWAPRYNHVLLFLLVPGMRFTTPLVYCFRGFLIPHYSLFLIATLSGCPSHRPS